MSRASTHSEMSHGSNEFQAWVRENTDLDELREAIDVVIIALGDRNISPETAGLYIQAIEDRRRELMYP
jgi:hypothetical protein